MPKEMFDFDTWHLWGVDMFKGLKEFGGLMILCLYSAHLPSSALTFFSFMYGFEKHWKLKNKKQEFYLAAIGLKQIQACTGSPRTNTVFLNYLFRAQVLTNGSSFFLMLLTTKKNRWWYHCITILLLGKDWFKKMSYRRFMIFWLLLGYSFGLKSSPLPEEHKKWGIKDLHSLIFCFSTSIYVIFGPKSRNLNQIWEIYDILTAARLFIWS